MEKTTTMAMVFAKESWLVPRMMQKDAPIDMHSHSHHNRPRMPQRLAAQSEIKPPAALPAVVCFSNGSAALVIERSAV